MLFDAVEPVILVFRCTAADAITTEDLEPVLGERLHGDTVVLINEQVRQRVVEEVESVFPAPCAGLGRTAEDIGIDAGTILFELPGLYPRVAAFHVVRVVGGMVARCVVRMFPCADKVGGFGFQDLALYVQFGELAQIEIRAACLQMCPAFLDTCDRKLLIEEDEFAVFERVGRGIAVEASRIVFEDADESVRRTLLLISCLAGVDTPHGVDIIFGINVRGDLIRVGGFVLVFFAARRECQYAGYQRDGEK